MTDQTQIEEKEKLVSEAQIILGGKKKDANEILALAKKLKAYHEFGVVRTILEKAVENGIEDKTVKTEIVQQWALSTYKDTHLNRKKALDDALEILQNEFDLSKENDPETFGIAGAIYKRKWETGGIKVHLETSLLYYLKGYKQGVGKDQGYTAINAAFVLDLLAYLEQEQARVLGATSNAAEERKKDAKKIRNEIIKHLSKSLKKDKLEKDSYWSVATLAEAYFGTEQYSQAEQWLELAKDLPDVNEWERISTAKQLVHLAKLQDKNDSSEAELEKTEAWQVLNKFLDGKATGIQSMYRGKVGLALSGGGFRSSFYHIGVMAKLAELNMLRHIEVLSCVSGGSILGAHYYLELRRLINADDIKDDEIDRQDYITIVNNMVDGFLLGVQENPRVRVLANPWSNLKMIFFSSYSRTQRLGELYEKLIYSRVDDGDGGSNRWLNGLYMYPEGNKAFLPSRDNWSRLCKIPQLILNATTLNTGHNWQFTASWMGESPTQIDTDVDANDRYRRTYYSEAPGSYKHMRLGTAVGASSCVPGLFEPIIFDGLYKDTTVRLIDGGVYDNQGVASLIEQDCNVIISSDATGQMNTEKDPGGGVLKPLLRTNTTLMQRVRNSQYQDLKARETAGILKGFAYVHLRQDLKGEDIDWIDSEGEKDTQQDTDAKTSYGIRKDIQGLLAGVRTDLDSFSEIEAYALMTSGYHAMGKSIESLKDFPLVQESVDWKFLKVESAMTQDTAGGELYDKLVTHLEAASMTFGKIWTLNKTLNKYAKIAGASLLILITYVWFIYPGWQPFMSILSGIGEKITINAVMMSVGLLLVVNLVTTFLGKQEGKVLEWALSYKDIPRRLLIGGGIGLVGWIGAFIHLRVFDKMFKKIGEVE